MTSLKFELWCEDKVVDVIEIEVETREKAQAIVKKLVDDFSDDKPASEPEPKQD